MRRISWRIFSGVHFLWSTYRWFMFGVKVSRPTITSGSSQGPTDIHTNTPRTHKHTERYTHTQMRARIVAFVRIEFCDGQEDRRSTRSSFWSLRALRAFYTTTHFIYFIHRWKNTPASGLGITWLHGAWLWPLFICKYIPTSIFIVHESFNLFP